MDNCGGGGGQRLPPDGDEFPAAYQEYTQQQQQQQQQNNYSYVTSRDKVVPNGESVVDAASFAEKPASSLNCFLSQKSSFLAMDADKRNTVTNYVLYSSTPEKKIEISGYYQKDSEGSCPPPLPLTEPPRVPSGANNDLWRQDNMSEKSVKDKIAMFSSQSNLEAPLFPAKPVTSSSSSSSPRRLAKHKSSDDVFAERAPPARAQSNFDLANGRKSSPGPLDYSPTYAPKSYSPPSKSPNNSLIRATSFSGSSNFNGLQTSGELLQQQEPIVTRTGSLASTFRRPSDDSRKNSLTQLIEQRRKSISKLRGLVIPEKDAVPVEQPITDLPEIKSRDSILVSNQVPRVNIQDKWGSQSSLASNASTVSSSVRTANATFKMPAPKILSSYSPAFKRKSLSVFGSGNNSTQTMNGTTTNNSNNNNISKSNGSQLGSPDAPKSLESICSPTRSDYSFEFVSSSVSPDNGSSGNLQVTKPKLTSQRKIGRNEYDDSDNDSAVSSSQSSISRGFSPPASPVPSDRSTMSSERSYLSSETHYQRPQLILSSESKSYKSTAYERSYSVPGKPPQQHQHQQQQQQQPPSNIPQRQALKRSVSSESESLSRRVLKPQSVEAINRKNILASARCRSGKELNGSPLIQRKFSDDDEDEEDDDEEEDEGGHEPKAGPTFVDKPEVKIAYLEITENDVVDKKPDEPRPKRSVVPQTRSVPTLPIPSARPPKTESLEASNDMKSWVRAEMRTLTSNGGAYIDHNGTKPEVATEVSSSNGPRSFRSKSSLTLNEHGSAVASSKYSDLDNNGQNDLLTVLTTKSRSRSAIHVEETCYNKLKSPMSLEDILAGKTPEPKPKVNGLVQQRQQAFNEQQQQIRRSSSNDSWSEDKGFPSKIPSLKSVSKQVEEIEYEKSSRIPMPRNLGRRSASVTDMKKVFEKVDAAAASPSSSSASFVGQSVSPAGTHQHGRFPSLDSSVEESIRPVVGSSAYATATAPASASAEPDQERFGSISSLASSTSLISQQELAQLVEEANLEEPRGKQLSPGGHDVVVVLLHKENPSASVGITLAGGVDCETKEISVHRVLSHSVADKEGSVQRGDRILSINGRSMRGLTHRESLVVLKQPRSELVLVLSRAKSDDAGKLRSRTESVETIVEGYETNGGAPDSTAWGPALAVPLYKDGAGLGFSLEGGRDSPLGDRPLLIKKIFTGGAADKTGALRAGDQLLEVNKRDVSRLSRIEAWSLMKKLPDGEVNLLVRRPATKSS